MPNLTLRPNGVGDYTNITQQTPDSGEHWQKVDEAVADDDDYVWMAGATEYTDAYELEDTSLVPASFDSVTVHFRCRNQLGYASNVRPSLRLNGVETNGTLVGLTLGIWNDKSEVLARPGGGSWTKADINALQVCIGLKATSLSQTLCSQLYIVVAYSTPVNATIEPPKVRIGRWEQYA